MFINKLFSKKIYTIKKPFSGTCMSIVSTTDMKPCVLAFENKTKAERIKHFMNKYTLQKQKLVIESYDYDLFVKQCSLTKLNIMLYDKNDEYTVLHNEVSLDDYVFHMNNTIKYF
jgi:hypothetical protein